MEVFKKTRVGEAGVLMQLGMARRSLCVKMGLVRAGRTYMSFLLVAEESTDGMVEMRGWEKGRYPLVSRGKDRAANKKHISGCQGRHCLQTGEG